MRRPRPAKGGEKGIIMTYKTFNMLLGAATEEADRDRYIAEWSSSSAILQAPEAPEQPDFDRITADLGNIWDVAHMSVADIRKAAGMTQAAFAERFCIPLRTVINWEARNTGTIYNRLMMADALGICTVIRHA